MRKVEFEPHAFNDFIEWSSLDPKLFVRISELITHIQRSPFVGIGKPEPLKFQWKGYWSRRINDEHRLVYSIMDDSIIIASCKFHYP
ncbi:MAG: Txe/YoeB family addiction module toxin [Ignavibacteria bacterium]|nr:Txe/YoeB family addiction module toxin [Ignavibacteria bacterium]